MRNGLSQVCVWNFDLGPLLVCYNRFPPPLPGIGTGVGKGVGTGLFGVLFDVLFEVLFDVLFDSGIGTGVGKGTGTVVPFCVDDPPEVPPEGAEAPPEGEGVCPPVEPFPPVLLESAEGHSPVLELKVEFGKSVP